jgi:hypothetical protein
VSVNIRTTEEIRAYILAGIVCTIRGAQCRGADQIYLVGGLAMAEHTALCALLSWEGILDEARQLLGAKSQRLLDDTLRLGAG